MTAPDRTVTPDDPLRLDVAAAVAYPDGSMTASGLRKEHARGNLVIERVCGRYYTTLADIARMREKCRLVVKAQDSSCDPHAATAADASPILPPGESLMAEIREAQAIAQTTVEELSERSLRTSRKNTPRKKGNVISLASRSPVSSRPMRAK